MALTDDTGIFQHAKYNVPRREEGYTTDDNARALIVCARHHRLTKNHQIEKLANIYLAFLSHMQKKEGSFHNFLGYTRRFQDVNGSEDSMGRALWGCGCAVNSTLPRYMRMTAKEVFDKGLSRVWKSSCLRFCAFTILGLYQYYQASPHNDLKNDIEKLADRLILSYMNQAKNDWRWFEHILTYDNARLPQALFEAYSAIGKQKYLDVAKESTSFLVKTQMVNDVFMPIGNKGWYKQGGTRAFYDQQPVDAAAMVEALLDGFYATKNRDYLKTAERVFEWFLGRNSHNVQMYNKETAGCFDGLNNDCVNLNQGAESCISFLLARLKMEEFKKGIWKQKRL